MTTTKTGKLDFNALGTSPEHQTWKKHRELLLNVSGDAAGFRGCIALGLLVRRVVGEAMLWGNKKFLHNADVDWLSITDIPSGFFKMLRRRREVHWATRRQATTRFGMPVLSFGSEGSAAWDFRSMPFDSATLSDTVEGVDVQINHSPDVLSPSEHPQLFRALNALEWAATSTAFSYRGTWQAEKEHLFQTLGKKLSNPEDRLVVFGNNILMNHVERPDVWMPKAYLGFPLQLAGKLYDRATRPLAGGPPYFSDDLRRLAVKTINDPYVAPYAGQVVKIVREVYHGLPAVALHLVLSNNKKYTHVIRFGQQAKIFRQQGAYFKAGEALGQENFILTPDWESKSPYTRWDKWLPRLLSPHFDAGIRVWFERQLVQFTPGVIHAPSAIAAVAALGNALDESHLLWDVSPSERYFNATCDTYVFPTIQIMRWDDFRGTLPGGVAYDLNPADPRFLTVEEARRLRAEARVRKQEEDRIRQEEERARREEEEACQAIQDMRDPIAAEARRQREDALKLVRRDQSEEEARLAVIAVQNDPVAVEAARQAAMARKLVKLEPVEEEARLAVAACQNDPVAVEAARQAAMAREMVKREPVEEVDTADLPLAGTVTRVGVHRDWFDMREADGVRVRFTMNGFTSVYGPRGGVSRKGVHDERLARGAEVSVICGADEKALEVYIK